VDEKRDSILPGYELPLDIVITDAEGNQTTRRVRGAYRPAEAEAKRLRAIPASDRLLTVVCTSKGRRVFAVVVRRNDMDTLLVSGFTLHRGVAALWTIAHECPCRQRHTVDPEALWVEVDHLRSRPIKARTVDIERVTTPV